MLADMYFEEYQELTRTARNTNDLGRFLQDYFFPVKYNDKILEKYFVDARGQIFSIKKGLWAPTKIAYNHNKGNSGYPKTKIDVSDSRTFMPSKYKTLSVHRLVCESFHEKPLPPGVNEKDWSNTPQSVKDCFKHYWEVHHIDHDRSNYHPSNLEWVSKQENVEKYQQYLNGCY